MESTDEIMHKKMQLAQENEAKDTAKKHQREIAKRKFDPNYKDSTSLSSGVTQGGAAISTGDDPFGEQKPVTPLSAMHDTSATAAVPQRKVPGKAMILGKPKKNVQ